MTHDLRTPPDDAEDAAIDALDVDDDVKNDPVPLHEDDPAIADEPPTL